MLAFFILLGIYFHCLVPKEFAYWSRQYIVHLLVYCSFFPQSMLFFSGSIKQIFIRSCSFLQGQNSFFVFPYTPLKHVSHYYFSPTIRGHHWTISSSHQVLVPVAFQDWLWRVTVGGNVDRQRNRCQSNKRELVKNINPKHRWLKG